MIIVQKSLNFSEMTFCTLQDNYPKEGGMLIDALHSRALINVIQDFFFA